LKFFEQGLVDPAERPDVLFWCDAGACLRLMCAVFLLNFVFFIMSRIVFVNFQAGSG